MWEKAPLYSQDRCDKTERRSPGMEVEFAQQKSLAVAVALLVDWETTLKRVAVHVWNNPIVGS